MPKLEPKQVQRELESGKIRPVYWLFGQESMKSRELLKRIQQTVEKQMTPSFGFDVFDATEVSAMEILDASQSLPLGGGIRFIVVKDAQALKEPEALAPLVNSARGSAEPLAEVPAVCVFISKDLDGRKKFSKLLVEKAAVVPCEEVAEQDREAWIGYLSKRKGLVDLTEDQLWILRSLDPWSLDIVDQELEKFSLTQNSDVHWGVSGWGAAGGSSPNSGHSMGQSAGGENVFLDAFLRRDYRIAMESASTFADAPEVALPLLGLLGWNTRQLALTLLDREHKTKSVHLNSFLAERIGRWARAWTLSEILELQHELAELDFGIKQTAQMPLGLWSSLVITFCRKSGERQAGPS